MRRIFFCLLVIALFVSCRAKHPQVDKIIEDGVEVVLNHHDPYPMSGKPVSFHLEQESRIDFSEKEFIDLGIAWPTKAKVDSEGNIFVLEQYQKSEYFISKFNKSGRFVKSIGRVGQGPGEVQSVVSMGIDSKDNIWACSPNDKRIIFYSGEGDMTKEVRYPAQFWAIEPLENGGYLAQGSAREKSSAGTGYHLWLYDANFHGVKTLDFYDTSSLLSGSKKVGVPLFIWKAQNDKIYIGNEHRGYEILVYNLDGQLLQKIRKEYYAIPYPKEFKEEVARSRPGYSTPDDCPPFNSFFIDENGYLFVMTYEKGTEPDEYWHDIFSNEGIFVGRASFGISGSLSWNLNPMNAVARGSRYYRLRFKEEDAYPEMIVYRMIQN
jgi:hypothetical protein